MLELSSLPLETLIRREGFRCACGHTHSVNIDFLKIGPGAVRAIPEALRAMGCRKPFIVLDENTMAAAWSFVEPVLQASSIPFVLCRLPMAHVEPDEHAVGFLTMAFDPDCDCVMGIGSGVINDCCKVLAHACGRKQMIVSTAPSMDGFASNSSAMLKQRIKTTIINACPSAILCDTDIMKDAPMRMLQAGFGDMLAKYTALCEWRIAHLVTGEYYCENVASLMRASLKKIVANVEGLKARDPVAVQATAEGLVLSGIAMSFAGVSRPASGQEHYFSHVWEMMALERNQPFELHGIQVGVGVLLTLDVYRQLREITPSRETAEAWHRRWTDEAWQNQTRAIFGSAAETLIALEHDEWHNNDPVTWSKRLDNILRAWPEILRIMDEELPDLSETKRQMQMLGMPTTPEELGFTREDTQNAFLGARSTRKKYLLSCMLWDLGRMDIQPQF